MQGLYQILYRSFAKDEFSKEDIRTILAASQKNNPNLDITGMLLYKDGIFLQLIEGHEGDLRHLYRKISNDLRHDSLKILYEGDIETRSFPTWSMAFKEIDQLDSSLNSEFANILNLAFSHQELQANQGSNLFLAMRNTL